jgi:hypothetical protein
MVQAGLGKKARLNLKNNGAKDMVQAVEHLPSKHNSLSSNPSYCPLQRKGIFCGNNRNTDFQVR